MLAQNTRSVANIAEILSYDPLVSDTACQNRAVYLAALALRIKTGNKLNTEDLEALKAASILTQTKLIQRHNFGYIIKEITDVSRIPEECISRDASNTAKKKFLAQNKKII